MSSTGRWTSPRGLSDRLVPVLCLGAVAIGIIVLIGYALGSVSIAALGTNGKPAAAVSALAFILLGAGLLALRWPLFTRVLTPRLAALAVIVLAAASLLSVALSHSIEEWQVWAARGGVYFHAFPITALLILALGLTLALATTRWDLAGHLIASAVLLTSIVFLFGYVLEVPSFFDPLERLAPVAVTASGLTLLSAAAVLVRPRGWVVPLLSHTSAGAMSRLLLPAIIVVPFFSIALNRWLTEGLGHPPQVGLTAVVAVNVFFSAAILLGAGAVLHKRESDRLRLASIVESSDDAIIGASSDGLIESWNAGAERMYGYTAAEAIGRSVTMLAPRERQDDAPRVLERIRRGQHIDPFETVRVTKDGRCVDVLMGVSPVLDDAGNVVGASTITHDISDRKKAEEELARVSERLAQAARAARLGIWDWDVVNDRLVWDNGMYALYGVKKEDFGGAYQAWIGGLHPDDRARSQDEARLALSGGMEYASEFRVVWPDGTVRHLATQGAVVRDEGGRPLRLIGVNSDITERTHEKQALRDSEAALAEAQQVAHMGSWVLDADSAVVQVSDEAFRIFEVEPRPVVPMQIFLDRIHEEDRAALEAGIAAALQTGTLDVEVRIVTPDRTRLAHIVGRKHGVSEGRPGLIGTTQDITEQKSAEDALRQRTESLERSNAELERFNRLAVGRELRMIELKRQINDLYAQLEQPAPYVLPEEHALAKETS